PRLDRLVADRLYQEALPHSRRSQPEDVALLGDEPAGRQVEHLLLLDRWVESPVELVQRLQLAEQRRFDPALELAVAPHRQLVPEDQLQELEVAQAMTGGLLEADLQALQETGEAQLL